MIHNNLINKDGGWSPSFDRLSMRTSESASTLVYSRGHKSLTNDFFLFLNLCLYIVQAYSPTRSVPT